jgi:hypothetical protein
MLSDFVISLHSSSTKWSERIEDLPMEIIDTEGVSKFSVEISTGFIEIKVVQNVDVSGLHSQARS